MSNMSYSWMDGCLQVPHLWYLRYLVEWLYWWMGLVYIMCPKSDKCLKPVLVELPHVGGQVTTLFGILGQVWYLIVSIPDLCTLTYFVKLASAWCVTYWAFLTVTRQQSKGLLYPLPQNPVTMKSDLYLASALMRSWILQTISLRELSLMKIV